MLLSGVAFSGDGTENIDQTGIYFLNGPTLEQAVAVDYANSVSCKTKCAVNFSIRRVAYHFSGRNIYEVDAVWNNTPDESETYYIIWVNE